MNKRNTNEGTWTALNQYLEINTASGECRLKDTKDIVPNLRYTIDGVRNYAVKSFKEKRSTDNTTATTYTPVRKVMIMLDDKLVEWDGREYWKPIEWNDYYQVSTWGNVRNSKGNYMSPCEDVNRRGYLQVLLSKDGKTKHFRVSRLVAEAFLPNPNNLSDVDHIDSKNKRNNMVDNLQWLSHADNVRKDLCKPVQLLDFDTEEVLKEFDSLTDATNYLLSIGKGRTFKSVCGNISSCLTGKRISAYGYKWKYKD